MCQLFSFSSSNEESITNELKVFFKNSTKHLDGWGLAIYKNNKLSLYAKEPIQADDSQVCKSITSNNIRIKLAIAHIRKATVGVLSKKNTHPFVRSVDHKKWTFAHNGTLIYDGWNLNIYKPMGTTDSEKIFCHLINELITINQSKTSIFSTIKNTLETISSKGKLNLMFSDGDILYIYSNLEKNIYFRKKESGYLFATKPLDKENEWKPVPIDYLYAFKDGTCLYKKEIARDKSILIRQSEFLNNIEKSPRLSKYDFLHYKNTGTQKALEKTNLRQPYSMSR